MTCTVCARLNRIVLRPSPHKLGPRHESSKEARATHPLPCSYPAMACSIAELSLEPNRKGRPEITTLSVTSKVMAWSNHHLKWQCPVRSQPWSMQLNPVWSTQINWQNPAQIPITRLLTQGRTIMLNRTRNAKVKCYKGRVDKHEVGYAKVDLSSRHSDRKPSNKWYHPWRQFPSPWHQKCPAFFVFLRFFMGAEGGISSNPPTDVFTGVHDSQLRSQIFLTQNASKN